MAYYRETFLLKILLFLFVISFFFTGSQFSLIRRSGAEAGATLQWHHLIFLCMLFLVLKMGKIEYPYRMLGVFWAYILGCSLANAIRFGINGLLFSAIYDFLAIIVIYNLFKGFSAEEFEDIISKAFFVVLSLVYINIISHFSIFINYFLHPYGGHPNFQCFVGGGINVEAVLIALMTLFVLEKRYGIIIWGLAFFVSLLYVSRSGIIVNLLVFLYYFLFIHKVEIKNVLGVTLIIVISLYFVGRLPGITYVFDRISLIGKENASVSRLAIWKDGIKVFFKNPMGVGCGNVMTAIHKVVGTYYTEGNSHNIFIQFLVDEGVVGIIYIIGMIVFLIVNEFKMGFKNLFGIYLLLYYAQGFMQTRGFEIWGLFMLPIFLLMKERWEEDNL